MTKILSDHNIEGQAAMLWDTFITEGWTELIEIELLMFADVGLMADSSDRKVWRFVQEQGMLLLTSNRNMKGKDSLEQTLRDENSSDSLPVLTIGNMDLITVREYREKCVTRIAEVVLDLENHLGTMRVFIP
ncbi:MAG: hypothetical protein AB7S75_16500 [Desulfococcaceae bacterium]